MFSLMKRLNAKEWLWALVGIAFIIGQIFLDLKMPDYMQEVTLIAQGQGELAKIWINGGYMLACAFGSMVCSVVTSFFFVRIGADFSARLRRQLYEKVQSFSLAEINAFSTASLITRSTNDVQQVQGLITTGLQMAIKAPVTAVWAIFKIAGKQWQWALSVAIAVVFMLLSIAVVIGMVSPKFVRMQKMTDALNASARENLSGLRVIRAYNAEEYQEKKFERANHDLTKANLFAGRMLSLMSPVMSLAMNGLTLAIYWIGAVLLNSATPENTMTLFSDMVVYLSYGMQIVSAFMMLAVIFMTAPRALVSAKRINEVLHTKESISDGAGAECSETGTVEFRNVSFRYPGAEEDVLTDISFRAESGKTVAIVGATGSGKSSLIRLIPRLYDVTGGEVLVDGVNVREHKKRELMKRIAYVPQRTELFSGDVAFNVDFGDNGAGETGIQEALSVSQSSEFVEKCGGIHGRVAQNGSNFSGGQKQRLAIARAAARSAEIYLFDDAFSALDFRTDAAVRAAIKQKTEGSTRIIVAQRISTVRDADEILVLEDGTIVGRGTHDELLRSCPTYAEIVKSQEGEERSA